MAFVFGDPGGRMYTSAGTSAARVLQHWTALGGQALGNVSVSAGNGRTTGSCLRLTMSTAGGDNRLMKTLASAQGTMGGALGFRGSAGFSNNPVTGAAGARTTIMSFMDAGTNQVDLRWNSGDNTLAVTRNGTVLGSTAYALTNNAYYHLEFKAVIHPSAGTVDVYINGINRISLSGLNTRVTANSSCNQVSIGPDVTAGNAVAPVWDFDDVIFWDGQTTDQAGNPDIHDVIGDNGLAWLLPTGAGTTTQFTPDSGSNYARVNEATPDGDTSYVEDATVGHIDTYAMADLPASAVSVLSLVQISNARKTDLGSRSIKSEIRTGGTNYASTLVSALGDTYLYEWGGSWGTNPNTGVAWTPSDVNAIESGQQVNA